MRNNSPLSAVIAVYRRDLSLVMRRGGEALNPLIFFIIIVSLFPLGVGPEPNTLRTIAPGIIWVAALLASMLALNRLFDQDFHDGVLELMALAPHPLTLLMAAKVAAHWTVSGLPLVLLAPILGIQMQLDIETLKILVVSLLLGTPILSLIGAIGAALTLGLRGGGVLVSLLVLPLYTPVLIFGAGAVTASMQSYSPDAHLSLLAALLALALTFSPLATAAALRISLD